MTNRSAHPAAPREPGRRPVACPRFGLACLALLAAAISGCMSVSTHTALLSDSSHLGTPFPGTRGDLHTLVCFGRDASRDPHALLLSPLMLVPLIDLPLSFALDLLLLPVDIPMEPERPPLRIGSGGCRLIGM